MRELYHSIQLPLFVLEKICSLCGKEKPLTDFYRLNRLKSGYRAQCKDCCDTKYKVRKHPGIRRESRSKVVAPGNKWCNGCRTEQPIENFTTDNSKPDRRSTRCNTCRNANYRKFYENCSDASKELMYAGVQRYQKRNPLIVHEISVRRRARQKNVATGRVSYKCILERDGMWCYICEQNILPEQKRHFDHVIPLARGGAHSEENIRVAHALCNSRKHDKLLEEMTPYQRRGPC